MGSWARWERRGRVLRRSARAQEVGVGVHVARVLPSSRLAPCAGVLLLPLTLRIRTDAGRARPVDLVLSPSKSSFIESYCEKLLGGAQGQ